MAAEIPIVRYFVACLEVNIEPDGRNVTLRSLIHAIVRLPGESFPCVREQMALYALLTNGRGTHDFAVELTLFEEGEERLLHRSSSRQVDLGQDPTLVLGLPLALKNVTFAHPGQYTFHLLCDSQRVCRGEVITHERKSKNRSNSVCSGAHSTAAGMGHVGRPNIAGRPGRDVDPSDVSPGAEFRLAAIASGADSSAQTPPAGPNAAGRIGARPVPTLHRGKSA